MNTNETADQLELAAAILRTGHPWEYSTDHFHWSLSSGKCPMFAIKSEWEIRLVLATPPDNRPFHNPDNLTAEQVGAGWRLTLEREKPHPDAQLYNGKSGGGAIVWSSRPACVNYINANTYRLPLSTPWPEVEKPLPTPPPGMQWHRLDGWKEGDLPQGWRPLVAGEKRQSGDEYRYRTDPSWSMCQLRVAPNSDSGELYRTTRPLVFTHEGKQWMWHRPGDPCPCGEHESVTVLYNNPVQEYIGTPYPAHCFAWKNPSGLTPIIGWRYADEPKMVELGPEDVTPLSIIRRKSEEQNWHWRLVSYVDAVKVTCADRGYPWTELATDYEINRSLPLTGKWNPNAWEPCHKLAP